MDLGCQLAGTRFRSIAVPHLPHSSMHIYEIAHSKRPKQEMPMQPPVVVVVVAAAAAVDAAVACCWRLLEPHNKPAKQGRCFAPNSGYHRYCWNCWDFGGCDTGSDTQYLLHHGGDGCWNDFGNCCCRTIPS